MIGLSRRRTMGGTENYPPNAIMTIKTNPEVLAVCYAQGWCANAEYMTLEEAQAVTDIANVFQSNKKITHFEELKYFGISALKQRAFAAASKLERIEIPDTNITVATYCFTDTKISYFHVKPNVQSLSGYIFSNVSAPLTVMFDADYTKAFAGILNFRRNIHYESNVYTVTNGIVYDYNSNVLVVVEPSLAQVTIPQQITKLNAYAFYWSPLTSIVIPSNITEIGNYCFNSTNLSSITLNEGLTTIGEYAFGTSKLTSIVFPNTLTKIGRYAFMQVSTLTSMSIPSSVTSFGTEPFYLADNITSIHTDSPVNINSLGKGFLNCTTLSSNVYAVVNNNTLVKDSNILFTVARGLTGEYTVPNGIETIGAYACTYCNMSSLVVISSVRTIKNSFASCYSLTNVTINEGCTTIENYAFQACSGLLTITLPSSITTVGPRAFYQCNNIEHIYVPAADVNRFKAMSSLSEYTSIIEAYPTT